MLVVKIIVRCFELISGLRVNFHKSQVGGGGVNRKDLKLLVKCLNCTMTKLPFKYLGLQIGRNLRRDEFWTSIIEKLKSKLLTWKGKRLVYDKEDLFG